ncbi:radical SAM family heme chaperone HemW [Spiroplasma culicicola]|uniref:Heme chaperone HemW n=1 Tax=Spiroplasma culicicola AES-1 TaxID=1276246 RepID=W6A6V8_9MOLU|nr:radical SAM family heme chaperone HemW [Spiroplasma culicicola]AHI52707.1 coproporphyrinogen III oxidase [Spiroplasma culicicola AES-1]
MKSRINNDRKINSLYVHIPFCEHICFYCDFVKVIKPNKEELIDEYLDNLKVELDQYGDQLKAIKSIYIGGGTPSCLNETQTRKMCEILKPYVKEHDFEYSIELNPESITEEKLKIYQEYHLNRLSIGVQTFNNKLLKKIGRIHDNSLAIEKYQLARKVGFDNISIDLMYNLFDQTGKDIYVDLEYISKLKPDHISWYSLIMKEDSIWGKKNLKTPGNDELFDDIVNEGLEKLGYQRYEISNYCLDNKYSRHNMTYWDNSLFAGVGVGAAGFEFKDGFYFTTLNKGNVEKYQKQYTQLSQEDYYFQIIMMSLRTIQGLDLSNPYNQEIYEFYREKIDAEIKRELLEVKENHLKATPRGLNILNEILVNLL